MSQSQTRNEARVKGQVADASAGNWTDTHAPTSWRPYLRLARADRPIGAWLLLWPCWWGVALAAKSANDPWPNPWHLILFLIGAFVMRAAGCVYNDLIDHEIDAEVNRTKSRPLPSGQVTRTQAKIFMVGLCLIGFLVLIQFNLFTIGLGIASLAIVAVYPFMKRITNWPQSVLGLAFAWGALVSWSARFGEIQTPAVILFVSCIAWIIAYDTIYAHQDRENDAMIGLGSTALRFGKTTKNWLVPFFSIALGGLAAAGYLVGASSFFFISLTIAVGHAIWQITTLDINDGTNCLTRFKSNNHIGWIAFIGLTIDVLVG